MDWSAVVGSGFVVAVLMLALVERLRRTFATKDELNGFGQRVNNLEHLYHEVREMLEDARNVVRGLESEQRHYSDRLNRQVIEPLQRITVKLEELAEAQISHGVAVKHIERWLDRQPQPLLGAEAISRNKER